MIKSNITTEEWDFSPGSDPHNQAQIYNVETGQTLAITFRDEDNVRARAIAAVPDLLEALEACLLRLDAHDDQSAPECAQARKALIKAGYTLD